MITLVLGGARSGKSDFAERRIASAGAVTYLATARMNRDDPDLASRVARHRARRPAGWRTVEVADDLVGALRDVAGPALVDSLGVWLAGLPGFSCDTEQLVDALRGRPDVTYVVSDEVGLGVHPESVMGREFRDALGALNRALADIADEAFLIVAGRALRLDAP